MAGIGMQQRRAQTGAATGVLLGTGGADPPPLAAARVLLRRAGFGAMPVAQTGDLEAGDVCAKSPGTCRPTPMVVCSNGKSEYFRD